MISHVGGELQSGWPPPPLHFSFCVEYCYVRPLQSTAGLMRCDAAALSCWNRFLRKADRKSAFFPDVSLRPRDSDLRSPPLARLTSREVARCSTVCSEWRDVLRSVQVSSGSSDTLYQPRHAASPPPPTPPQLSAVVRTFCPGRVFPLFCKYINFKYI